ncbi:leucine-rich colipase-like protein 1 isoform X2 [Monodelphis domestica]|uniref:leucine-rich colipase-like protein 1 isoform X2 n=1 Tax=Monodelphis domestica TaxID=13616 RepID=UPI0024E24E2D|nr:leucine-rich colipase-like protein 1 isoform X2 [Monodelphis domestica]
MAMAGEQAFMKHLLDAGPPRLRLSVPSLPWQSLLFIGETMYTYVRMLLGPFTKAGILKLLLISLILSQGSMKFFKKSGEPCKTNTDCHSECCVLNTSVQKICRRRTFFRQCNSWQKSLGYNCKDSSECFSNCCTYTSNNHQKICAPRTIFLQCLSWKKEEGEVCSSHEECISDCCLRREEDEVFQCTEKTGLFIKCLLLPAKTYENEKDIFQRNIRGNWRKRMKAAPVTQPVTLAATGRGESN